MGVNYIAKLDESIPTKPGCWNYTLVGIYEVTKDEEGNVTSEVKVGEYQRNYHGLGPFYAFQKGDKWYALYSKEYMYTRVMSLPECVDLGGEDSSNTEYKNHFCPVEYYVPIVCIQDIKPEDKDKDPQPKMPNHDPETWAEKKKEGAYTMYVWPDDKNSKATPEFKEAYKVAKEKAWADYEAWMERHPFITKYADFGFIGGMQWGDDTSVKLEFLDLREADKGIIKRDDRFGYLPLPGGVELKDAVDVHLIDGDEYYDWSKAYIKIARTCSVNLEGKNSCWYNKELFDRNKEKFPHIRTEDYNKVYELFSHMWARGLDDEDFSHVKSMLTLINDISKRQEPSLLSKIWNSFNDREGDTRRKTE